MNVTPMTDRQAAYKATTKALRDGTLVKADRVIDALKFLAIVLPSVASWFVIWEVFG